MGDEVTVVWRGRKGWHGDSPGHRLWRGFVRAQAIVTGTMFVWIIGVAFLNVTMRYVFSRPIVWADEAARLSFIVFAFLAAALAVAARSHLVIDAVVERMPSVLRRAVIVATAICAIALFGLLMVGGWRQSIANLGQASPALRFPLGWVYMGVPVAGAIMFLNLIGTWWYGPYELPKAAEELAAEEFDEESLT